MNKKYLILKKKVPKAQWGKSLIRKSKRDDMFQNTYGTDAFLNTPEAQIETEGLDLASDKSANISAGVGMGLQAAQMGADFLFDRASEKNSATSGYGDEIVDAKDVKLGAGKGAVSGALKGAQMGMAFGPWGAAIGGVVGGAAGLIAGKKKAEKEKEEYEKGILTKNKMMSRSQDILNSQALTAKSGTKLVKKKNLGAFTIQKKKILVLNTSNRRKTGNTGKSQCGC